MRAVWIRKLITNLLLPVSQREALRIAYASLAKKPDRNALRCRGARPDNYRIYNHPEEPCWYVDVPWGDGFDGEAIRSGRVILVGKRTGKILYDGASGDEG